MFSLQKPRPPISLSLSRSLSLSLMAFNHRKLTLSSYCERYCDPIKKKIGFCSTSCLSECSETCYNPPPERSTTPPSNDDPSKARLHLFLIISLSILAATFFLFCCYNIYKFYKNRVISRRRSSQPQQEETHYEDFLDEDRGPVLDHPIWYIRTVGLQPSIIDSITVCKYKRGEGLVEGTDCSVCLSEFQEDETLRLLPKCNHAFHIPCIDTWLRSHTNCPMCRAAIVTSPAGLPAMEQSVEDSVVREETQAVISESGGEFRREREDGASELRMGTEEEGELQVENGGKSPETSKEEVVDTDIEVQPMRRSVSMDSLSASLISAAIANAHSGESAENSGAQLAKVNESNLGIVPKKVDFNQSLLRLVGGSSIGRSLQKGPILMKRSLSCSGKVLLSRYTRSRNSPLPP